MRIRIWIIRIKVSTVNIIVTFVSNYFFSYHYCCYLEHKHVKGSNKLETKGVGRLPNELYWSRAVVNVKDVPMSFYHAANLVLILFPFLPPPAESIVLPNILPNMVGAATMTPGYP